MIHRDDVALAAELGPVDDNKSALYGAEVRPLAGYRIRIRSRHQGGMWPFTLLHADGPGRGTQLSVVPQALAITAHPATEQPLPVVDLEPGDIVQVVDTAELFVVRDDRRLENPYLDPID